MNTIVVGAGINGVAAAIELCQRGHDVALIDPGPLPHPLAASSDISKAVRAVYGADEDYTALADRATQLWREWNQALPEPLFHEVGFLCMRKTPMRPGDFEYESLQLLARRGRKVERITSAELRQRYPAWNSDRYVDGLLDVTAGYAESGRVVAALIERAKSLGVKLRDGCAFADLRQPSGSAVDGIILRDGDVVAADKVVMAVGAWTPFLLPFTRSYFRATAQPVFHLQPREPELFTAAKFPVFGADLSTSGYYGFPVGRSDVVKIGNHGPGREMSPDSLKRTVTADEVNQLREFLSETFPALSDAPLVHTRICFYCDTHDGDFWIARDPERAGLVIATGDCGHGFKFAPVLGELIADAVEEKANPLLQKFRWRPEVLPHAKKEAARATR